ncbi:MAG: hypothetical protein ACYTDW_09315 [Planctomycetota bacterium]
MDLSGQACRTACAGVHDLLTVGGYVLIRRDRPQAPPAEELSQALVLTLREAIRQDGEPLCKGGPGWCGQQYCEDRIEG